jgi:hypothetical protein
MEDTVYSALSKSLNYAVTPVVVPVEDTLYGVEKVIGALPEETAEVQQETVRILYAQGQSDWCGKVSSGSESQ